MSHDPLYERDFYSWTQEQAELLRSRRLDALDIDNILEEIETLGRSELSALKSCYRLIALHLLKLINQPDMATPSWEHTINRERGNLADLIDENPSLKSKRAQAFAKGYARARRDAAFETKLPDTVFPKAPPFDLNQVESAAYWPEGFPRATHSRRDISDGNSAD